MILRVSTETIRGFKLIARDGISVQEVFIVTQLNKELLTQEVNLCNPKKIKQKK